MQHFAHETLCRWLKNITPKRRSNGQSKITDFMIAAIESYVFEHPEARAWNVVQFLSDRFNIKVSRQLVQIIISARLNYSFKRTRKRGPDTRHNPVYHARVDQFVRTAK